TMDGYIYNKNADTAVWTQRRSSAEFHVRPASGDGDTERRGTTLFAAADHSIVEMWVGWNGTTPSAKIKSWTTGMTGGQFNADLDNPQNNRLPAASCVAAWQGSL